MAAPQPPTIPPYGAASGSGSNSPMLNGNGNGVLPSAAYSTLGGVPYGEGQRIYYAGSQVPYGLTSSGLPGGVPIYYGAEQTTLAGSDPHGKKRRLDDFEDDGSMDDSPENGLVDSRRGSAAPTGTAKGKDKDDKGKRVKTVRAWCVTLAACVGVRVVLTRRGRSDSCRRKKIRCNPIDGTEPPVCQHCKNHGFECTWVSCASSLASLGSLRPA